MKYSIVIPVYNEAKQVEQAMEKINSFMKHKQGAWECLIVSDGSKDQTRSIVQNYIQKNSPSSFRLLHNEVNRGKGFVVRQGALEATGDLVLVTDVDLSSPIKEMDKLEKALANGADVAIGSRAKKAKDCDVVQSFKRKISGRIFNGIVSAVILRGFKDTQCGFKMFTSACAKELFVRQKLEGFSFDVEILYLAQKLGYTVSEVPVMWRQGQFSKVSLVRDSVRMVRDLLKIKSLHKTLKPSP